MKPKVPYGSEFYDLSEKDQGKQLSYGLLDDVECFLCGNDFPAMCPEDYQTQVCEPCYGECTGKNRVMKSQSH